MRNKNILLIVILMISILTACSDQAGSTSKVRTDDEPVVVNKDLVISTHYARGSSNTARSLAIPEDYGVTSATGDYSALLKKEIRDDALYPEAVTPSFIILHLNDLQLFNTEDVQSNIFNANGDYITLHNNYGTNINMLSTKGLSSFNGSESGLLTKWHHLVMTVVAPWVGPQGDYSISDPYTMNYTLSMVGIQLPEGIAKEDIKNALNFTDEKSKQFFNSLEYSDEYVWFQFEQLIPFDCGYPASVVFSDTTDHVRIYHKLDQGDIVSYYHVGYTKDGVTKDASNMSIIEIPMKTLDFSNINNPEIEISYHADDLIRFYSDGYGKYYAFFSPDNPFPISIEVKEAEESASEFAAEQVTVNNASDASPIFCRYGIFQGNDFFTLQFTMPNYNGITGIEIYHNTQNDVATATKIYEGNDPILRYRPDDMSGEHYFWICSVLSNGQKSDFKQFQKGFAPY